MRFLSLLLFLFAACTNAPYRGCGTCGADDLVIDSYQVQEGKFAILEMEGKCRTCLDDYLLQEYRNVIQEGDILQVVVRHPTRSDLADAVNAVGQNVGFRVEEGMICLPGLEGIEIAGLSLNEAKEHIQRFYCEEIADVEVFLSYRERTAQNVALMGLVERPFVPVDGKVRLFDVLAQARVPAQANLFKSYVVREGVLLPIDLYKLVKEGDMTQNIVMRRGDKIYIAESSASSLMVLGEVNKQRVIDLPNGFMTLRQAIAEAGGIPASGDKRFIQIIRGNMLCPKIYTVNWQHIVRLPSDSLLLIPGDIVYVAATPIAEWDRFVNQILPTLVGLDLILRHGRGGVGVIIP